MSATIEELTTFDKYVFKGEIKPLVNAQEYSVRLMTR